MHVRTAVTSVSCVALSLLAALVAACDSGSSTTTASAPKASATAAAAAPTPQVPTMPAPSDVAAPPPDAVKTPSGLASKVIVAGTGKDHPSITDNVKIDYTGWTKDGHMFDSSVLRGEPVTFAMSNVIAGWAEGLPLMVTGEKRRFWVPAALAFGNDPRPGAPAGDLTYDIELQQITTTVKTLAGPEDVKAPPASAKKTPSGLAYRVLQPGTGTTHPTEASHVIVNYSGWTPDGKMFDSSVTRGQPASFGLNGVIKGWTEGVQLMTKGEKMRFWIPGALAYGDKPKRAGAPAGMLVFDIELIDFQ